MSAFDAPVSLGEGLRQAIRQLGLSPAFRAHRAVALWSRVVIDRLGSGASDRSAAQRLEEDGTLLVRVDDDAWRHRLMLEREEFRREVNDRIGGEVVLDIRFVRGTGPRR